MEVPLNHPAIGVPPFMEAPVSPNSNIWVWTDKGCQ